MAVLERIPNQTPTYAICHPRIDDRMQSARKSFSSFAFNCDQIDEWMPQLNDNDDEEENEMIKITSSH